VKLCKPVNGAEFSLSAHGYQTQLHEHRIRLSKSAAIGRRQERIKSAVGLHPSPVPLDYEFEPAPETILRAVVSDLLPSCSLAADVFTYDEAFFAAACGQSITGNGVTNMDTVTENEDGALKQTTQKAVLNRINSRIQERTLSGANKSRANSSVQSSKANSGSRPNSDSRLASAMENNDDEKVLSWNNSPSCIAMQTNVLRYQCAQSSVTFDVDAVLRGERCGDASDRGPIESASERLILAAGAGDLATVVQLLEADEVNVDVADVTGRTALFAAAVCVYMIFFWFSKFFNVMVEHLLTFGTRVTTYSMKLVQGLQLTV